MNHLHVPQALAAAEAGKHLLIEKPASHSLDDLRHVQRAIREAGVKSLVGFELHWSPYFNIDDPARTHEIVLAAELSAREGRPVSLQLPG